VMGPPVQGQPADANVVDGDDVSQNRPACQPRSCGLR
jgi:hypothetical protein